MCVYIYIYIYIYINPSTRLLYTPSTYTRMSQCAPGPPYVHLRMYPHVPSHISCTGFTIISTTYVSKQHNTSMNIQLHAVIWFVSTDILKRRLLK